MPNPEDSATLQAHWTSADNAARRAERKWGAGRLPTLVSAELLAKFERQRLRLFTAYDEAWEAEFLTRAQLDAVVSAAGGMVRAWSALDAAAEAAGHAPQPPEVWETKTDDGRLIAVVRDVADASRVLDDDRQSPSPRYRYVYSLDEVAQAVKLLEDGAGGMVDDIKCAFPGATLKVRRLDPREEIPF
jgi:hypothetical protein